MFENNILIKSTIIQITIYLCNAVIFIVFGSKTAYNQFHKLVTVKVASSSYRLLYLFDFHRILSIW